MNKRIIARLDIKGPNLVKGIHLEGLRVLGSPEHFADTYYRQGADELFYQDVVASLYGRNSLVDFISTAAKRSFIPLTVGGGIRTIEDIQLVLRAGADKVSLNTAVVKRPEFVHEASRKFGSSTIVVSVEAIKDKDGRYLAYIDNGREYTGLEVLSWCRKLEELGAGEILLTSVDREGTGLGYDVQLTKMVSTAVSIPVIAHGGAGKPEDIREVLVDGEADAVAIASLFHYGVIRKSDAAAQSQSEGNLQFLKSGKEFGRIVPMTIPDVKSFLRNQGLDVR